MGVCCFMRRKNITSKLMMEYIADALLLLMKHKNFNDITIGEITKKAGVNRSTYYRHFSTKESIIKFYFSSIMNRYKLNFQNLKHKTFETYIKTMFDTFYKEKDKLLLIHKSNLSSYLLPILIENFNTDNISKINQFRISYHIGGINNCMLLWFSHNMQETPNEMLNIVMKQNIDKSNSLFNSLTHSS